MNSVPIAMVVERPGFLEYPGEFLAARPHVVDVGLCGLMAVLKSALFFRLSPKHFVVPVRVERRIDVDKINAFSGKLAKLVVTVPAVNNSSIDLRRMDTHRILVCH